MVRRYADAVEVRARSAQDDPGGEGAPDSFLWRGRLYVVRSVLAHWRERRAWWNEPAARAVHGEAGSGPEQAAGSRSGVGEFGAEQEVWRVEASAGHRAGTGVYVLRRSPVSSWFLECVAD